MEPRRVPPSQWAALLLFVPAMAGIFCFARGIAYFTHHRSPATGAVFLVVGLVLYVAAIAVGRLLRRRRTDRQG